MIFLTSLDDWSLLNEHCICGV